MKAEELVKVLKETGGAQLFESDAKQFSNWKLVGSGQYGMVYSATVQQALAKTPTVPSPASSTVCAIKYVNCAADGRAVARLVREVKTMVAVCKDAELSKLVTRTHSMLCATPPSAPAPGVCLVMDLAGGRVRSDIVAGKFSGGTENESHHLAKIAVDVATALQHMHRINLVHLDVALRNVLHAHKDDGALLCDFGLAREIGKKHSSICSVRWASPNTLASSGKKTAERKDAVAADDVWQFGIFLWELYGGAIYGGDSGLMDDPYPTDNTGKPEFAEAVRTGMRRPFFAKDIKTGVDPNADAKEKIPVKEIQDLIVACTAFDAAQRPTMAAVVATLTAYAKVAAKLPTPPPAAALRSSAGRGKHGYEGEEQPDD